MKYLKLFFLLLVCLFLLPSCDKSLSDSEDFDDGNNSETNEVSEGDTIDYRALVFVEEADMEYYGGSRVFQSKLEKMFQNTTLFWNNSKNKFKYYFRFVPAGIQTYKIEGKGKNDIVDKSAYAPFKELAKAKLDKEKYDFTLFFSLGIKEGTGGLSCGGSGNGHSVVWASLDRNTDIFYVSSEKIEPGTKGTYGDLGHEYGHVRGAKDLYQYKITAENNPISHEAYPVPECNMGTGNWVWSDYCSALFNYDAHMKQIPDDLGYEIFPEKAIIRVKKNGEPVRAKLNIWGTRAGGKGFSCGVWSVAPFLTKTTSSNGEFVITNLFEFFNRPEKIDGGTIPPKEPNDEFPYSCWFCFLIEADVNGDKGYAWFSDLDIVPKYLVDGIDPYELEININ